MINKKRWNLLFVFFFMIMSIPMSAGDKPKIKIGGALRFNYNYSDWKPDMRNRGGDFGFDMFRLNAKGTYKQLIFNAEYRFYPSSSGGSMLKTGWIGYRIDDTQQLQLGLTTVPFGILPYTANSYFFNIGYYLGLEDDADMGLKYMYKKGGWDFALAFFKNSDVLDFSNSGETNPNRYAYDIAGRNKEINQGNVRIAYHLGTSVKQEFGISAMVGGLYNLDTEKTGTHSAFALHYVLDYKHWNLKAQYTINRINPKCAVDDDDRIVAVAAYGSPYNIAAKSDIYTIALAYDIPVNKGVLDNIRLYNDFSWMHKRADGFSDSYQNITGCLLSAGPVYTYIDYAMGKNQAWLGKDWTNGFAAGGPSDQWNVRFNMNVGYYF